MIYRTGAVLARRLIATSVLGLYDSLNEMLRRIIRQAIEVDVIKMLHLSSEAEIKP